MKSYNERISQRLNIAPRQAEAVISLLDEGNTIPFIARYRKEITGSLDELVLRKIDQELTQLRKLDDRKETVRNAIAEQDKLTPQLQKQIETIDSLQELEDLYQPYKRKQHTRADKARQQGLEPLAKLILEQPTSKTSLTQYAAPFLNEQITSTEMAFDGARDIVAEIISNHADIRSTIRDKAREYGQIRVRKIADAEDTREVYALYYEFNSRVSYVKPHQTLAINRGEKEKILRVHVDIDERDWLRPIQSVFRSNPRSPLNEQLSLAIEDSANRLLLPAIERDIRRILLEEAEQSAIQTFEDNLRGLLTQPPIANQVVMGIDPAYRTGCKIAIVDETGDVITTTAIYPHKPQNQWQNAKKRLIELIRKHHVTLIAIGNGTASRETEQLAAEVIQDQSNIHYIMVNESGASVYSASELAREELPDLDVTLRGAVSIARRVQDPLAELVKIDPQSIGVGLYQHDLNQKSLSQSLQNVVESVVNQVGVELNTASPALLSYVAGIGPKLAQNIVAYRNEHGQFTSRAMLKKVKGLGPKAFEQCAGFVRVRDGKNPLDATAIHPESYAATTKLMNLAGIDLKNTHNNPAQIIQSLRQRENNTQLAQQIGVGVPTLQDIFDQLIRPGRDPREDLPKPILRRDVLSMDDLREGMTLQGTVRNVVDFGAFVDIGVKQDGLLHISQIPRQIHLQVGDVIQVKIKSIDIERGRIGLTWAKS